MTKRKWLFLAALTVAALALGLWQWRPRARSPEPFRTPEFRLSDAQGKDLTREDLRDRWTVVHVWASWCAPCLEEIPDILKFAKSPDGASFKFLLLSTDTRLADALKVVGDIAALSHVRLALDAKSTVAERFGTFQLPETYLVGPDRKIRMKWIGPQPWSKPAFQKAVAALSRP